MGLVLSGEFFPSLAPITSVAVSLLSGCLWKPTALQDLHVHAYQTAACGVGTCHAMSGVTDAMTCLAADEA